MTPKQLMWDWLKAENRYRPPVEETRPVYNRAARRRIRKSLSKLF